MRRVIGWATAPAVGVGALALAAALTTVAGTPAQGAPRALAGPSGPTGTPTETPTTPTPTPTDTPTPTPTPTVTPPPPDDRLLPDLIALPAKKAYIRKRGEVRRLRFESALGNRGAGPIEVRPNHNRPCPEGQHNSAQVIYRDVVVDGVYDPVVDTAVTRRRAGCMVFHPLHDHWHFKASARYTLFVPGPTGEVVVTSRRKVSFCLRDSARLPERYGTWDYPEAYGACRKRSPQGISVGWVDIYQSFLAGQSLRLPPGLAPGLYCLATLVDPINQLAEVDDTNNGAVRALRIRGDRVIPRPRARCL